MGPMTTDIPKTIHLNCFHSFSILHIRSPRFTTIQQTRFNYPLIHSNFCFSTNMPLLPDIFQSSPCSPCLSYSVIHHFIHSTVIRNIHPQVSIILTSSILLPLRLIFTSSSSPFFPILITLLLPSFTVNFHLRHTLPKSCTSLSNFSLLSTTNTVSSANINHSTFHSQFFLASHSVAPTSPTHSLTSFITPSINTFNNHGDITHPCRSPTLTLNHSPSSLHTLTQHSLLSYILCTAANNFPFIPYIHSTRHIASLSILSYAFSKSIYATYKLLFFPQNFSLICFITNT